MIRMLRWLLLGHPDDLGNVLLQCLDPDQRDKIARAKEALETESTIETFTFLAYDEGGMKVGPTGAHRLVCVADSGAKVVIFGRERSMKNINAVLEAGLPCMVQCETHPASQSTDRFADHTHWVWEYSMHDVASARVDAEGIKPPGRTLKGLSR